MSEHIQRAAVTAGLALIAHGVPLRTAAKNVGVAPSSLSRARARAGLPPLPRGKPVRADKARPAGRPAKP